MSEVLKGDYIGFTFNGVHSSELGIIRTSEGSRFNDNLLPTFKDRTVEIPGGDGSYFFGSNYTQRQFSISIAYDSLTDEQLRRLRQVFGDKGIHDLIFDENPYKIYKVKSTGTPQLKYLAFDANDNRGHSISNKWELYGQPDPVQKDRIYKGEGTLTFIAYDPYAYSRYRYLDEYNLNNVPEWGSMDTSYAGHMNSNYYEWKDTSRMLRSDYEETIEDTTYVIDTPRQKEEGEISDYDGGALVYNPGDIRTNFSADLLIDWDADYEYLEFIWKVYKRARDNGLSDEDIWFEVILKKNSLDLFINYLLTGDNSENIDFSIVENSLKSLDFNGYPWFFLRILIISISGRRNSFKTWLNNHINDSSYHGYTFHFEDFLNYNSLDESNHYILKEDITDEDIKDEIKKVLRLLYEEGVFDNFSINEIIDISNISEDLLNNCSSTLKRILLLLKKRKDKIENDKNKDNVLQIYNPNIDLSILQAYLKNRYLRLRNLHEELVDTYLGGKNTFGSNWEWKENSINNNTENEKINKDSSIIEVSDNKKESLNGKLSQIVADRNYQIDSYEDIGLTNMIALENNQVYDWQAHDYLKFISFFENSDYTTLIKNYYKKFVENYPNKNILEDKKFRELVKMRNEKIIKGGGALRRYSILTPEQVVEWIKHMGQEIEVNDLHELPSFERNKFLDRNPGLHDIFRPMTDEEMFIYLTYLIDEGNDLMGQIIEEYRANGWVDEEGKYNLKLLQLINERNSKINEREALLLYGFFDFYSIANFRDKLKEKWDLLEDKDLKKVNFFTSVKSLFTVIYNFIREYLIEKGENLDLSNLGLIISNEDNPSLYNSYSLIKENLLPDVLKFFEENNLVNDYLEEIGFKVKNNILIFQPCIYSPILEEKNEKNLQEIQDFLDEENNKIIKIETEPKPNFILTDYINFNNYDEEISLKKAIPKEPVDGINLSEIYNNLKVLIDKINEQKEIDSKNFSLLRRLNDSYDDLSDDIIVSEDSDFIFKIDKLIRNYRKEEKYEKLAKIVDGKSLRDFVKGETEEEKKTKTYNTSGSGKTEEKTEEKTENETTTITTTNITTITITGNDKKIEGIIKFNEITESSGEQSSSKLETVSAKITIEDSTERILNDLSIVKDNDNNYIITGKSSIYEYKITLKEDNNSYDVTIEETYSKNNFSKKEFLDFESNLNSYFNKKIKILEIEEETEETEEETEETEEETEEKILDWDSLDEKIQDFWKKLALGISLKKTGLKKNITFVDNSETRWELYNTLKSLNFLNSVNEKDREKLKERFLEVCEGDITSLAYENVVFENDNNDVSFSLREPGKRNKEEVKINFEGCKYYYYYVEVSKQDEEDIVIWAKDQVNWYIQYLPNFLTDLGYSNLDEITFSEDGPSNEDIATAKLLVTRLINWAKKRAFLIDDKEKNLYDLKYEEVKKNEEEIISKKIITFSLFENKSDSWSITINLEDAVNPNLLITIENPIEYYIPILEVGNKYYLSAENYSFCKELDFTKILLSGWIDDIVINTTFLITKMDLINVFFECLYNKIDPSIYGINLKKLQSKDDTYTHFIPMLLGLDYEKENGIPTGKLTGFNGSEETKKSARKRMFKAWLEKHLNEAKNNNGIYSFKNLKIDYRNFGTYNNENQSFAFNEQLDDKIIFETICKILETVKYAFYDDLKRINDEKTIYNYLFENLKETNVSTFEGSKSESIIKQEILKSRIEKVEVIPGEWDEINSLLNSARNSKLMDLGRAEQIKTDTDMIGWLINQTSTGPHLGRDNPDIYAIILYLESIIFAENNYMGKLKEKAEDITNANMSQEIQEWADYRNKKVSQNSFSYYPFRSLTDLELKAYMVLYSSVLSGGQEENIGQVWREVRDKYNELLKNVEIAFTKPEEGYSKVKTVAELNTFMENVSGYLKNIQELNTEQRENSETEYPCGFSKAEYEWVINQLDDDKKGIARATWNGWYGWYDDPYRAKKYEEIFGYDNGIQALVNLGPNAFSNIDNLSSYSYRSMYEKWVEGNFSGASTKPENFNFNYGKICEAYGEYIRTNDEVEIVVTSDETVIADGAESTFQTYIDSLGRNLYSLCVIDKRQFYTIEGFEYYFNGQTLLSAETLRNADPNYNKNSQEDTVVEKTFLELFEERQQIIERDSTFFPAKVFINKDDYEYNMYIKVQNKESFIDLLYDYIKTTDSNDKESILQDMEVVWNYGFDYCNLLFKNPNLNSISQGGANWGKWAEKCLEYLNDKEITFEELTLEDFKNLIFRNDFCLLDEIKNYFDKKNTIDTTFSDLNDERNATLGGEITLFSIFKKLETYFKSDSEHNKKLKAIIDEYEKNGWTEQAKEYNNERNSYIESNKNIGTYYNTLNNGEMHEFLRIYSDNHLEKIQELFKNRNYNFENFSSSDFEELKKYLKRRKYNIQGKSFLCTNNIIERQPSNGSLQIKLNNPEIADIIEEEKEILQAWIDEYINYKYYNGIKTEINNIEALYFTNSSIIEEEETIEDWRSLNKYCHWQSLNNYCLFVQDSNGNSFYYCSPESYMGAEECKVYTRYMEEKKENRLKEFKEYLKTIQWTFKKKENGKWKIVINDEANIILEDYYEKYKLMVELGGAKTNLINPRTYEEYLKSCVYQLIYDKDYQSFIYSCVNNGDSLDLEDLLNEWKALITDNLILFPNYDLENIDSDYAEDLQKFYEDRLMNGLPIGGTRWKKSIGGLTLKLEDEYGNESFIQLGAFGLKNGCDGIRIDVKTNTILGLANEDEFEKTESEVMEDFYNKYIIDGDFFTIPVLNTPKLMKLILIKTYLRDDGTINYSYRYI